MSGWIEPVTPSMPDRPLAASTYDVRRDLGRPARRRRRVLTERLLDRVVEVGPEERSVLIEYCRPSMMGANAWRILAMALTVIWHFHRVQLARCYAEMTSAARVGSSSGTSHPASSAKRTSVSREKQYSRFRTRSSPCSQVSQKPSMLVWHARNPSGEGRNCLKTSVEDQSPVTLRSQQQRHNKLDKHRD